jgi:hypothetical protein
MVRKRRAEDEFSRQAAAEAAGEAEILMGSGMPSCDIPSDTHTPPSHQNFQFGTKLDLFSCPSGHGSVQSLLRRGSTAVSPPSV